MSDQHPARSVAFRCGRPDGDSRPVRKVTLSLLAATRNHPVRTLILMPTPLPSYVLEPGGSFTPDPDNCWHCRHNPGYPHRHWRQAAPPQRPDGPLWRFLFRVYGGGQPAAEPPDART